MQGAANLSLVTVLEHRKHSSFPSDRRKQQLPHQVSIKLPSQTPFPSDIIGTGMFKIAVSSVREFVTALFSKTFRTHVLKPPGSQGFQTIKAIHRL